MYIIKLSTEVHETKLMVSANTEHSESEIIGQYGQFEYEVGPGVVQLGF